MGPKWLNPPFWWTWPSLPVELVSGLCCFGLGSGTAATWLVVTLALGTTTAPDFVALASQHATFMAFFYELVIDRNGFSWKDVLQRCAGIALAALAVLKLF